MKFSAASSILLGLLWSASVGAAPNEKDALAGTFRDTEGDRHYNNNFIIKKNRKLEDGLLTVDETLTFDDLGFASSGTFDVPDFNAIDEDGTVHLIELLPGPFPIGSAVECEVPNCDDGFYEFFFSTEDPPASVFDMGESVPAFCTDTITLSVSLSQGFFAFTASAFDRRRASMEGRSASGLTFVCQIQPLTVDDPINADDDSVPFFVDAFDPSFPDDTIQVIELFVGQPGKEITCTIDCTLEPTTEVEWGFSSSIPLRFESDASGACNELADFTFVSQDGLHFVSIITTDAAGVDAEVGCMETPSLDIDETLEVNSPTPAPVPTVATFDPGNEDDTVVVFQLDLSTVTRGGVPAARVSAGDIVTCVLECTDADQSDGAEEILALNQDKLPTSLFASDVVEQSHCTVTASLTLSKDNPLLFAAVATREASLPLDATIQCTAMTPLTPAPAPTSPPDDGGHTCYPAVWIRKGITSLLGYFDSP